MSDAVHWPMVGWSRLKAFGLVLSVLLSVPAPAWSEDEVSDVTLHMRTIKANGAIQQRESAPRAQGLAAPEAAPSPALEIDGRLADLKSKLSRLPYTNFRLLSTHDVPVLLRRKTTIRLDNGQLLNVRLLYADAERVGMWVRWSDKDGMELLDSRMHFKCDEPVVTGATNTTDSAVILALDVERKAAAAAPEVGAGTP